MWVNLSNVILTDYEIYTENFYGGINCFCFEGLIGESFYLSDGCHSLILCVKCHII